jgi:hypothetical protein
MRPADAISPGRGGDVISGGAGVDSYYYGNKRGEWFSEPLYGSPWGHDTITDTASSDNPPGWEGPSRDNEIFFNYVTEGMTIDLVSSKNHPEVITESGTSTLNWSANVVNRISGGFGDDTIRGNAQANLIYAGWDGYDDTPSGSDVIFAGGGDDIIWVNDFQDYAHKDDRVDCGRGQDTVYYDYPSGDVLKHCETTEKIW